MQQLSMMDVLCPPSAPEPDYWHGRCACGWLLAGWHIRVVDQDAWRRVRHLSLAMP